MSLRDQLPGGVREERPAQRRPSSSTTLDPRSIRCMIGSNGMTGSLRSRHTRRTQAQELIQSVKVMHARDDKPDLSLRAFHAIRDGEGFAYKPTDEILADPLLTKMLLADMQREWLTLRQRSEHLHRVPRTGARGPGGGAVTITAGRGRFRPV